MDNKELKKQLLGNMNKMLAWIGEEYKKHNCKIVYNYEFERGFVYGHRCDYLEFVCSDTPRFTIHHYGSTIRLTNGKLIHHFQEDEEITTKYLAKDWCDTIEITKAFMLVMDEWAKVKSAVLGHLAKLDKVGAFEI